LSGRVAIYNKEIMNITKRGHFENYTTGEEFRQLKPEKLMMLPNAGMYCTSLTRNLIKNYKFQDSFLKQLYMNPSIQREKDFYGLSVNVMFEDSSKVVMNLLVSSINPSSKYYVYNKSEKFELLPVKGGTKVQIESENNALIMSKYEIILNLRDVEFIGAMLKVYDDSDSEVVFDCYMRSYSGNNNIKEEFKLYRHTLKIILDKKLLPGSDLIQKEEHRVEVKVAGNKMLSLLGKKPASERKVEPESWDKRLVWVGLIVIFALSIFLLWYGGILEFLEKEFSSREEVEEPLEEKKENPEESKEIDVNKPQV